MKQFALPHTADGVFPDVIVGYGTRHGNRRGVPGKLAVLVKCRHRTMRHAFTIHSVVIGKGDVVDIREHLTTGKWHCDEGCAEAVSKEDENCKRGVDRNFRLCTKRVYNNRKLRNQNLNAALNVL